MIATTSSLMLSLSTFVFLTAAAATSQAQGGASSFGQLQGVVEPGDTIRVIDDTGAEIRGILDELLPTALTLRMDDEPRILPENTVRQIYRMGDSIIDGAGLGFLAGAIPGAILGALASQENRHSGPGWLGGVLFLGGIGAGVGAITDHLIFEENEIYRNPLGSSSRVSLLPVITRDRRGIVVSIGF